MGDTNKSSVIEAFAANIIDTKFENLDRVLINNAKDRIIDVIGSMIGGANAPGIAAYANLIKKWGGEQVATIPVHGIKAPAHNVAMVNSSMARSYDFEIMASVVEGKVYASHHSATMVPTALAMSEALNTDGKDLITALIVGDDITARILVASGFDFDLGWGGTCMNYGTTAIAGRILKLSKIELRNAFGIVLNQIGGSLQNVWDSATTYKFPQGLAARNGIFAAELAKSGWTGIQDSLFSNFGYFHLYTRGCKNLEILTRDLGNKYWTEANFKPYPCCLATHAPIDATLAVASKHNLNSDNIQEVTIYLPQGQLNGFCGKPFEARNFPHCDAMYSFQYTVAVALQERCVKQNHFTENYIRSPQINQLINKTRLAVLPADVSAAVKIEVKMNDGQTYSETGSSHKGDPINSPLSKDEIFSKYISQIEFSKTVSRKNAEKILQYVEKLEEVDSMKKVMKLLVV